MRGAARSAPPSACLASALRAVCCFDGAGIALPATVLACTALVGTALELVADRRRPATAS